MQVLKHIKQKTMLILILAILILCVVFIFISCGTDPQLKITDPETGQFAVDFSTCPATKTCKLLLPSSSFENDPNKTIADKELTAEAWVMSKATSTSEFNGGIFARFDSAGGIALYAKAGKIKAAIRRIGGTGSATFTADYIVSNATELALNTWTHIAAVLTSADHSSTHADCTNGTDDVDCASATTDCNDRLHFDLYIDGEYKDCNTTYGYNKGMVQGILKKDPATDPDFTNEPGDNILSVGVLAEALPQKLEDLDTNVLLPGVVDEGRLWGIARTKSEIQECMNRELSFDSGTCGRRTDKLISYTRLNEGSGGVASDWAGLGSGSLFYGIDTEFTEGWVDGAPIIKKD